MARSVDEILQSTCDSLFPDAMGARKVSMDSRDCDGDTPLHVLLWRRDMEGVRTLIGLGADVDAIGDMGQTPLHVALSRDLPEAVALLLDAGASTQVRCEFGDTAAERADKLTGPAALAFRRWRPSR